jgi:hypothetical protein
MKRIALAELLKGSALPRFPSSNTESKLPQNSHSKQNQNVENSAIQAIKYSAQA